MRPIAMLAPWLALGATLGLVTASDAARPGPPGVAPMTDGVSIRPATGSSASAADDTIDDPVDRVTACFRTCDDAPRSDENRPTCVLRCVSDVEPKLEACAHECLEDYARCWNPCASERPRTDEFTCRLNCEQAADQCVGACEDVDASA